MSRPAEEQRVRELLTAYLVEAEQLPPSERPITVSAIRRATGISRTTLYKYGVEEAILASSKIQLENTLNGASAAEQTAYDERLRALQLANEQLQRQNTALIARMQVMEGNAGRLGVDPEELYRPLSKPARGRPSTRTKPPARTSRKH